MTKAGATGYGGAVNPAAGSAGRALAAARARARLVLILAAATAGRYLDHAQPTSCCHQHDRAPATPTATSPPPRPLWPPGTDAAAGRLDARLSLPPAAARAPPGLTAPQPDDGYTEAGRAPELLPSTPGSLRLVSLRQPHHAGRPATRLLEPHHAGLPAMFRAAAAGPFDDVVGTCPRRRGTGNEDSEAS